MSDILPIAELWSKQIIKSSSMKLDVDAFESMLHELGHISGLSAANRADLFTSIITESLVAAAISREGKQDSNHFECVASAVSIVMAKMLVPEHSEKIQKISEQNLPMNIVGPDSFRDAKSLATIRPIEYMRKLIDLPITVRRAKLMIRCVNKDLAWYAVPVQLQLAF